MTSRIHKRGFASMDPEKRREIASMGGKAAHKAGTAHRFTSEEARAAAHLGAKLTEKQVREIRKRYKPRLVTYSMLAKEYGVSPMTVCHVLKGHTWGYLSS